MNTWLCEVCGYVYDPQLGAEDVPPGTPFEELPDDWVCPECYAEKDRFNLAALNRDRGVRRPQTAE